MTVTKARLHHPLGELWLGGARKGHLYSSGWFCLSEQDVVVSRSVMLRRTQPRSRSPFSPPPSAGPELQHSARPASVSHPDDLASTPGLAPERAQGAASRCVPAGRARAGARAAGVRFSWFCIYVRFVTVLWFSVACLVFIVCKMRSFCGYPRSLPSLPPSLPPLPSPPSPPSLPHSLHPSLPPSRAAPPSPHLPRHLIQLSQSFAQHPQAYRDTQHLCGQGQPSYVTANAGARLSITASVYAKLYIISAVWITVCSSF